MSYNTKLCQIIRSYLHFSFLLFLEVLVGLLVGFLFQRTILEIAILKLFGFTQSFLRFTLNFRRLRVLIDEACNHLPPLIRT